MWDGFCSGCVAGGGGGSEEVWGGEGGGGVNIASFAPWTYIESTCSVLPLLGVMEDR